MSKMNFAQLKFPPYEWIKGLPLTRKEEFVDRATGKTFYKDVHLEYTFKLFDTPVSVYGRLTYNEDDSGMIFFDVMEDGYCDHNSLGKGLKFNKRNYKIICDHAQSVYENFQRELLADKSYLWSSKIPEEYAEIFAR